MFPEDPNKSFLRGLNERATEEYYEHLAERVQGDAQRIRTFGIKIAQSDAELCAEGYRLMAGRIRAGEKAEDAVRRLIVIRPDILEAWHKFHDALNQWRTFRRTFCTN